MHIRRGRVVKTFVDPAAAQAEAAWYLRVPWAAPRLITVEGASLTIEGLPAANRMPRWRPADALRALLERLHSEGIHHRDVHPGNIVRSSAGAPLLIDWETAIHWPSRLSYDLRGPDASGVPVPDIHAHCAPQWWGSEQRMSIKNRWRV